MSNLRNAVLFALAFDATDAEIANAVENINRFFDREGIEPSEIAAHTAPNQTVLQLSESVAQTGLDSANSPWDERIHASTKAQNADGTWRTKRGVDKATLEKVSAEIKLAVAQPASPTAVTIPTLPAPSVVAPALPGPPGLPSLPAPVVNSAYADFITFLAANTASDTNPTGRLTADWVKQVLTAYGVPDGSVQNLAHNPELLAGVHNYIKLQLG